MAPVIAIVGGGIAGLSAALAFARLDCRVHVFEGSQSLQEVGAGLQLSPNATRLIDFLGLSEKLADKMVEPTDLTILSGMTLRMLCRIPSADFARQNWQAPYGVIHRADLQFLLAEAVSGHPNCTLQLGEEISVGSEISLATHLTRLTDQEPDLIIGADGVWSSIRDFAPGGSSATFTGSVAWRAVAGKSDFTFIDRRNSVNAFLAPHTHMVVYPLMRDDATNVVAVTPGRMTDHSWDSAGNAKHLQNHFSAWHPDIVAALGELTWRRWPLFEIRRTCFRAGDKTVLIGDAAHALTPHAAQGAAMAIEDACALAACFEASNQDIERTIGRFEALRQRRVARVRRRGDFNKFTYHARGPVRFGRDLVLTMRAPEKLAHDLDWLYGHDASTLSPG